MKFRFLSLCLIVTFAMLGMFFARETNAQFSSNSILINTIPANPAPNENMRITLSSYGYNLDSVLISWSVDGRKSLSGIGEKSLTINAPASGSATSIVATISLSEGTVEARTIIRPASMTLLWQADDSYVPPFYKGKAMPSADSAVKVVAIPERTTSSKIGSSKNMIYTWKKDYTNDQEASGYGKNSFTYINDYLDRSNSVSVTATTTDQSYSEEANINVGIVQPKILFYKNDVTLGTIWEQALLGRHKIENEEVIEAVPYFMSPKDIQNPLLVWNWSINDSPVDTFGFRKNLIPLRAEVEVSGTSRIRLEISNKYKIFGTAEREITVEF